MRNKHIKHLPLYILILINLLFAIIYGGDFNESWDEQPRYNVALEAIARYRSAEPAQRITGKGPIYYVTAKLGGDLIRLIRPHFNSIQAWHYIHFLTFLLGVIAFYIISLKFLPVTAAFASTTLFNSQPLLIGHAFINPKDIPFMSSFLVILATGFLMADHLPKEKGRTAPFKNDINTLRQQVKNEWLNLKWPHVIHILCHFTISMISLYLLFIHKDIVQQFFQQTINHIDFPLLYRVLDFIAASVFNGTISGGIAPHNIQRAYPFFIIAWGIALALGSLLLFLLYFPKSLRILTGFSSRKQYFVELIAVLRSGWVYPAGIILGLSINNRSLSITAGLFVLFYIWVKHRKIFLPACLVYLGLATIILYITWPGLWGNPVTGLIKSLLSNTSYSWGGSTLFRGQEYKPEQLPLYYLPYLMGIQFTIPAIALGILGFIKAILDLINKSLDKTLFSIFTAWFLLPFVSALILKPAIYHNFRHFLFMTPPIFFFSGLGIKTIFEYIPHSLINSLIILLILFPSVLGLIQLHPYQYIYYNQLVGGVKGAFRSYEMDYWLTSFQECVDYLNEVAGEKDVILVYGPLHLVNDDLREDLETNRLVLRQFDPNNDGQIIENTDYVIMPTRMNHDLIFFPTKPTVFSVQRNNAILSVIKDLH